jgi:hypothetical protein
MGEGEPWGSSKGGLDHEDRIRISYVLHRPSRPRSVKKLHNRQNVLRKKCIYKYSNEYMYIK